MSDGWEQTSWKDFPAESDAAFERDLTVALRPLQLPENFVDRAIASAAMKDTPGREKQRGKVIPFGVWRLMGGVAIAAALVGGVLTTENLREHREREHRAAIATQQFEAATRITDQALAHTREELDRAGVLRGD